MSLLYYLVICDVMLHLELNVIIDNDHKGRKNSSGFHQLWDENFVTYVSALGLRPKTALAALNLWYVFEILHRNSKHSKQLWDGELWVFRA